MNVTKQAAAGLADPVEEQELELINQWSRTQLTAEQVYAFGVCLCDNEVDRDGERFPEETLAELAPLFVGKSGVFDHQWSARGQTARIYRTELVREKDRRTAAGDEYCYLKGYAYMLRTPANEQLIAEIEGGIKKEVSVGCAVEKRVCSICGGEAGRCGHEPGVEYEGKLCCAELRQAADAYEWSFVAVPAQPRAGVLKGLRQDDELDRLRAEAALGRKYLKLLRDEVVRLGGLAELELEQETLKRIVQRLEEAELDGLKRAFEARLDKAWSVETQLPAWEQPVAAENRDGAFLI